MSETWVSIIRRAIVAILVIEALGFITIAGVHLGAEIDLPGYVEPRASSAAVAVLCALGLVAAGYAVATRRPFAWEIGVGVQVACVAAMLVIDKVLSVVDVTPIYRIGIAAAGVVGILLLSRPAKAALGRTARMEGRDPG